MTYQEFIQNILQNRGRFGCGKNYHERHHIQPKCIGGDNEQENLIDLYPQEHYLAHKLLALENPHNQKLQFAWWSLSTMKNKNGERIKLSEQEYEEARKAFSKAKSDSMKGDKNQNWGTHRTEETKKKIGDANRGENSPNYGTHISAEHREKLRQSLLGKLVGEKNPMYGKTGELCPNYGKQASEEARKKMSESHKGERNYWTGKHIPEETRKKMSEARKGYKMKQSSKDKLRKAKSIPIQCVETGEIFESAKKAAEYFGIKNTSGFVKCCKNPEKTYKKKHWKYYKVKEVEKS